MLSLIGEHVLKLLLLTLIKDVILFRVHERLIGLELFLYHPLNDSVVRELLSKLLQLSPDLPFVFRFSEMLVILFFRLNVMLIILVFSLFSVSIGLLVHLERTTLVLVLFLLVGLNGGLDTSLRAPIIAEDLGHHLLFVLLLFDLLFLDNDLLNFLSFLVHLPLERNDVLLSDHL